MKGLRKLFRLKHSPSSGKLKKFRLLIIGKSGCGKTTILSKVCGENMSDAPSTVRGVHNIETEIVFERNDKLVAHDSEGFEAGRSREVDVVKDFIKRRSKMNDINDKLHIVWYCMEMNSRPIQHAEREFFTSLSQVPVLAVVTKFDIFVQDVLQEIEEAAESDEDSEFDDEQIHKRAVEQAMDRFDRHYREPLNNLPFPPKAVLTLSETHNSTPDDSRLAQLIQETMKALADEKKDRNDDLGVLFATAQNADSQAKMAFSLKYGMHNNYGVTVPPLDRSGYILEIWNTFWSDESCPGRRTKLCEVMEEYLDKSPRIIGHPDSADFAEVRKGFPQLLMDCRCQQMVADTALIMEKVFILKIEDEDMLRRLIIWYDQHSTTAVYVRKEIVREYRRISDGGHDWADLFSVNHLIEIIRDRPKEALTLQSN